MSKKKPAPSAAAPNIAANNLPSLEEDYKRSQLIEDMFTANKHIDTRKRWNFADEYLTPGKIKKKDPALSKPLEEPVHQVKQEIKEALGMILPRNFCPDCGRTDRPFSQGVMNVSMYPQDRPDLHLRANSLLISIFCQECARSQFDKARDPDRADSLEIVQPGGTAMTKGELDRAERLFRIKQNTEDYIRSKLLAGDNTIFPDGKDRYHA